MKTLAATVGAAFVATKVVSFLGDSVTAASDLSETVNKSNVIFKDNAAEIEAWAGTAASSVGLSKQAALDSVAGFGNMLTQLGFTGDAAAEMSTQVVTMAADLGSFNNLETGDVADRMSAAFRGEYDSLQALIPNINAARVEQEALAATGKKNADELTAQEKATAVLAIVQKDGAAAAGDFANTSDGLANSQKILGANMEDLKSVVGQALVPALGTLVAVGTQVVTFFSQNQAALIAVAAIVGGLLVGAFISWAASIIATNVALLANPITLIVLAIIALIAGVILAYKNFETFRNVIDAVWAAIQAATKVVVDFFMTYVWPTIRTALGYVVGYFKTLFAVAKTVWTGVFGAVRTVVSWFMTYVWPTIRTALGYVIGYFKTLFGVAKDIWTKVFNTVKGAIDKIGEVITAAKTIFSTVFDGLKGAASAAFNGVASLWNSTVGALSFSVPDWVPLIGGRGWDVPDIPMLAAGGIVNRPTLAVIGEAGPEAVIPLANMDAMLGLQPAKAGVVFAPNVVVGDVSSKAYVRAQLQSLVDDLTRQIAAA